MIFRWWQQTTHTRRWVFSRTEETHQTGNEMSSCKRTEDAFCVLIQTKARENKVTVLLYVHTIILFFKCQCQDAQIEYAS